MKVTELYCWGLLCFETFCQLTESGWNVLCQIICFLHCKSF